MPKSVTWTKSAITILNKSYSSQKTNEPIVKKVFEAFNQNGDLSAKNKDIRNLFPDRATNPECVDQLKDFVFFLICRIVNRNNEDFSNLGSAQIKFLNDSWKLISKETFFESVIATYNKILHNYRKAKEKLEKNSKSNRIKEKLAKASNKIKVLAEGAINKSFYVNLRLGDGPHLIKLKNFSETIKTVKCFLEKLDTCSKLYSKQIDDIFEHGRIKIRNARIISSEKIKQFNSEVVVSIRQSEDFNKIKGYFQGMLNTWRFLSINFDRKNLMLLEKQFNKLRESPEYINDKKYENIQSVINFYYQSNFLKDQINKANQSLHNIQKKVDYEVGKIINLHKQQRPKSYYAPISVPKLDFGDGVDDDTSDLGEIKLPPTK